MTDHLPECPLLEPCDDDVPEHGYCSMQRGAFCIHCHQWCICDRLRACEERVRHEGLGVCIQHYDAGVQAAREAVLNAGLCAPHRCQSDALAAIDALMEKP